MSAHTNSWSWRDRFYAFLLRRALGPILTPQSAADLHQSIDAIDWSTGELALVDVRLDPTFLTSAIHQNKGGKGSKGKGNDAKVGDNGGDNSSRAAHNIAVYEASIRRCAIHLSLCNIDQRRNGEASSTARKATSMLLQSIFGPNNNTDNDGESVSGMALKVYIELEGLHIVLAPGRHSETHSETEWSTQTQQEDVYLTPTSSDNYQGAPPPAPGFFSKLLNSAMKSLRLSIDISDVNIRLFSQYCKHSRGSIEATISGKGISENERASWVGLRVASARYYDLIETTIVETLDSGLVHNSRRPDGNRPDNINADAEEERTTKEILVISKALDWEGVIVESGETVLGIEVNNRQSKLNVPILQGCGGKLRLRVFEKWSKCTEMQKSSFLSARQDIKVSLGQRMSAEFNLCTMARIIAIAKVMTTLPDDDMSFADASDGDNYRSRAGTQDDSLPKPDVSPKRFLSNEFSKDAYDKIMKQYVEERHFARTRELRGGLLVPSFDESDQYKQFDQEGISFDAFFDANDHSFSHYSEIVDDRVPKGGEDDGLYTRGESDRCMNQTEIELALSEFTVKVHFGSSANERHTHMFTADETIQSDFVLLSIGDLGVVVLSASSESKLNCSVSHFDIEYQMEYGESINDHLLRFRDEAGSEFLVSSPPSISLTVCLSDADAQSQNHAVQIDVSLFSFDVIYHERAFRRLLDFVSILNQSESSPSDDRSNKSCDVHLSASCSSIVLLLPCENDSNAMLRKPKSRPLFRRHGYINQGTDGRYALSIGVEIDSITVDLSRKQAFGDSDAPTSLEQSKAVIACNQMILFAAGSEIERGRRNRKFASFVPYRADLIALTGDGENGSSILISYSTQMANRQSAFPIVLPLSSTKARQDMDASDDEIENVDDDTSTKTSGTHGIHALDPQYVLASEANEADRELVLNIPHIFFDCTSCEREELSRILSLCIEDFKSESSGDFVTTNPTEANVNESILLGLAINVDQISVVLHGPQIIDSNSYGLIMDKLKIHSLIDRGVRNVRCLCHDVTLYEMTNLSPTQQTINQRPLSCDERCRRIRARLVTSSSSSARAIFFRQKLYQSLSPETPSILIDLLLRSDDECDEMRVHVAMYDMTYRYIMNSQWAKNLSDMFGITNKSDGSVEASPSMINLFLNLTDCNIDYTSSVALKTPSRLILRVGEIRFSSNIVTPSTIQTHNVSSTDLLLYICNHRHSYNEENSRLSWAQRHMRNADISVLESEKCLSGNIVGLDDGLSRMGFVNVAALDTLDTTISKSIVYRNGPTITVSSTMGKLSIFACHDSFSCLVATYNEWFIKATALSDEDMDKLRKASESECLLPIGQQGPSTHLENNDDSVRERNAVTEVDIRKSPSSIGQQDKRDDIVSLDLTKSLLFQNYYTFDATATHQPQKQRHPTEHLAVTQRSDDNVSTSQCSIDDEWATVEHSFLQYSNIPLERDYTAEWTASDAQARDDNTHREAVAPVNTESLSQTVKVYPQHIPVKPVSDPFSVGRIMDTENLGGIDVALPIGMRMIIRDASLAFQFFDGFDWVNDAPRQSKAQPKDRKQVLLGCLVDGHDVPGSNGSALQNVVPLPEERNDRLQREIARRKLRRNPNKFFNICLSGLKMKNDSYSEDCQEHRPTPNQLASSLVLSVADFFMSETISTGHPVKMIGEWINEMDHPRDSSDGMIMLKMRTKHPRLRLSSDGKLMSDESRASLEILPLRCCLNQNALRFVRNFFAGGGGSSSSPSDADHQESNDNNISEVDDDVISDDGIIDIFFELFKVKSCKLKVDYQPESMDIHSFREGNFIELLNMCPLEDMILSLKPVEMSNLTGWGSVMNELSGRWLEDICSTQAHKFVTRASPFQPISNLSDPLAELAMVLIVPEGSLSDYFRGVVGGTTVFAGQVLLEALSTSAKLTRFAANQLNRQTVSGTSPGINGSSSSTSSSSSSSLHPPRRPRHIPRSALDTTSHAYESIVHGLSTANYKIITVPLREYQIHGATGAARSALRGIPVGVLCPIAGASEAISYTLLGLRNQLRPDIWKEEEANLRGLDFD